MRQRLSIVGAVAAASLALIVLLLSGGSSANAGGGSGGPALNPDLLVETPDDVLLQRSSKKSDTFLRFSHTTSNVGVGPMEIYPDLDTTTCGEKGDRGRVAYQRIYNDTNASGVFERQADGNSFTEEPVGCMIYHAIHDHYHFEDFARYELYRMSSGKLKRVSDKVSFCVADAVDTHPDLPGAPEDVYYLFSNCDTDTGIHGISVGWADIYGAGTPGQEFNVTGLNPGRYCLVAMTDPTNRLQEVDLGGEDNNVQTVQIKMNLKKASALGSQVNVLDKPCTATAA